MRSALQPRVRLFGVACLSVALVAPALPAAAAVDHSFGSSTPAAARGHDAATDPAVTIRRDQRGHAHYVGAPAGRVLARGTDRAMSPVAAAREHLGRFAADFGISSPATDLRTASVRDLAKGQSIVRFQQTADGLPVLGGQLVSVLDSANNLLSVSGETSTAVRSSTYSVTAAAARAAATRATAADHGLVARELVTTSPEQWLYDASLFDSTAAAGSRAVWRVEVTARDRLDVRELVLVDGATGRVVLHVDEIERAVGPPNRVVCDNNGRAGHHSDDYFCDKPRYRRTETGPASSVPAVNYAFVNAGAAASFYATLGVDLTALIGSDYGDGKKLRSTVRFCPTGVHCPYANAFWDGFQMVYGSGFAKADDVVGHELTHGVTQNTNGLVYWYQSGAINESMSDVFGEFIDQTDGIGDDGASVKWLLGEDLPNEPVARNMMDPPALGQPDRVGGPNWTTGTADNGGVHNNNGVGNKAAFLITDGGTFHGQTITGLGIAKAAQLYWLTENLLTPGADYADLAGALSQACSTLVTSGVLDPPDCPEVDKATLATQMVPASDLSAPQNVSITGGYGQMRVRWSAPANGSGSVNSYVLIVKPAIEGQNFLAIDDPGARDVTIGGVPVGRTLTFSLIAVSTAGNSPESPPIVMRGTKLTMTTASTVPYKRRANLTGRLTFSDNGAGVAGRAVTLYRKVAGKPGYRLVRSKTTSSSGGYSFQPHQTSQTTYFVFFPSNASGVFGSRSSKHAVSVAHRVSFRADDLSVRVGRTVHFSGRVRPADRGVVTLQRRRVSTTTWTTFATAALSPRGRYALAWTPRSGRDFEWRVVVKKSSAYARGVSRIRLVRVT